MDLKSLFASLPSANQDRKALTRRIYAEDAARAIILAAIRASEGRVPTVDEIVTACASIQSQVAQCDTAMMEAGGAAVAQASDTWLRTYWGEPREGVSEALRSEIATTIAQPATPSQPHERSIGNLLMGSEAWEAYSRFDAARTEWRGAGGRTTWLAAERTVLGSADLPEEVRSDLLEAARGDTAHVTASTEIMHWKRGLEEAARTLTSKNAGGRDLGATVERAAQRLETPNPTGEPIMLLMGIELHAVATNGTAAVMRLLDRLDVDPLAPSDLVTVWPGHYSARATWHLYDRADRVVIAAINPGDHTWSDLLVRPGTLSETIEWMTETYRRERDARPTPIDSPPTLADTLQARRTIEAYREAQAICRTAWQEMTVPT